MRFLAKQIKGLYACPTWLQSVLTLISTLSSPLSGASFSYTDPVSQPLSSIFLFLGNSSCESFHAIPFKYPMILEVRPRNLCHNKKRDPTFAFYFPLSFCMNKRFRGKPRDPCSNYSLKKMTWKRLNSASYIVHMEASCDGLVAHVMLF